MINIRRVIALDLAASMTVDEIAADLVDLHVLGLDPKRSQAVERLRASMLRQQRPPSLIKTTIQRYADRLLRQRARSIARHEVLSALNEGQQLSWEQAADTGVVNRGTATRVWITTPDDRLCPFCVPQEGNEAKLGEDYVLRPPAVGTARVPQEIHAVCRCAEGLNP